MQQIADRMEQIPFSSIRTIFERVHRLECEGTSIIHLEIGRPDFDTPEHIKRAGYRAIDDGHVHYTSNYGILPLRQAIAHKLAYDNHLDFDPKTEIIVTAGVSEGIMMTMLALLNPGDEVLIPEPVLPCYVMAAQMAGAVPIIVPVHAHNGYQPALVDLVSKLSVKTKMLVVNTPGNPSGVVLHESTLRYLANFSINNNLLVMADEIYEKLIYDDRQHISIASLPGMRPRTITLNGFSKSYAMTGWRLGYVAADAHLIQALVRIHQYSVVCANSFAQWGGIAALEGPQTCVQTMVAELNRRRLLMTSYLQDIPGLTYQHPQGAMYVYANVSGLSQSAYQLADDLLEQAHIAVVPWDQQHIRIAYGNSYENLKEALDRIGHFFAADLVC
ncbi:MAG: pyridoxal phosphate-dependent aminotransferase [Methylovulum sp.]|nr:pyridoxal phosphate-dependent aminotransferase [Methylovulum sp.]